MKYEEIKNLSLHEVNEKIKTEEEVLQKLKFAHAISPIENPMKIKHTRKYLARLKTAQRAKKFENNQQHNDTKES
ncbi:MAG: 50S ribosomal protein L29 [Cytophagales bacterium]|jgi:large subunit ribosomal protein L29|nr:50S ribosomal protein L29 [Cytophagales bacterium]